MSATRARLLDDNFGVPKDRFRRGLLCDNHGLLASRQTAQIEARRVMDENTRLEIQRLREFYDGVIDKLHGRISDLKNRVTVLETTVPHINASLIRIEQSVAKLAGHLSKAMWIFLAAVLVALAKFILGGGLAKLPPI